MTQPKYDFNAPLDRSEYDTVTYTFCPPDVVPMWVADVDVPMAPEIHRAIVQRAQHPTFGYTIQPERMWNAVSRWLERRQGWRVPVDQFVFSPNLVMATVNALKSFTRQDDAVAFVTPLYTPLQDLIPKSGRRAVECRLPCIQGRYVLDPDQLRDTFTKNDVKFLIWCSPLNPSGRIWSKDELAQLVQVCRDCNVFLLSDEVHADLTLWGAKHTPIANVCSELGFKSFVVLSGPGKSWGIPGLHVSFVVIPDPTHRSQYNAQVEHAYMHFGSAFATVGMEAAYQLGEEWLDAFIAHLQDNILFLGQFIKDNLPEIKVMHPEASFLVWVDCSGLGLDGGQAADSELTRFFREDAKVMPSDGFSFGGAPTAQYQRLNVACSRTKLVEALNRIHVAVERLRERRRTGTTVVG